MKPGVRRFKTGHILYDEDAGLRVSGEWFDPAWLERRGLLTGQAPGRGTTRFFAIDERELVLRHYQRGGAMAGLLGDLYLRTPLAWTRAWREWKLLARLYSQGLPVPCPISARVVYSGAFYRCDLITTRLAKADSFSRGLAAKPPPDEVWKRIGQTIRSFHDQGVWHADLNAHNILLDEENKVYLIDFDRCRIRQPGGWRAANLARLKRSLGKILAGKADDPLLARGWPILLDGYQGRGMFTETSGRRFQKLTLYPASGQVRQCSRQRTEFV